MAAVKYGIEEQVHQLIEIGGLIEETKVDASKAKVGLEMVHTLHELGVEPEGAPDFIKSVIREAEIQHLSPEKFVKLAKGMYDEGVEGQRDYDTLFEKVASQKNLFETIKKQASEYEEMEDEAKTSMNKTLEANKVTTRDLEFHRPKGKTRTPWFKMDDLSKVESCIVNVAERATIRLR